MVQGRLRGGLFAGCWQNARLPVLVLNGDASFPFTPAAADAVAAELPNATPLAGQGHGPRPEVIAPVPHEFLAG